MATSPDDILQVLASLRHHPLRDSAANDWTAGGDMQAMPPADDTLRDRILESLSPTPVDVDSLIRSLGVPTSSVLTILLELELAGRIERHPGNKISRA